MIEIKSFHRLASFYRRFKDFSTIAALLNKVVKNSVSLKGDKEQDLTFNVLKEELCFAPVLALPGFTKAFKIKCDASKIRIRIVLMQDRRPITYFHIFMVIFSHVIKRFMLWKEHLRHDSATYGQKSL